MKIYKSSTYSGIAILGRFDGYYYNLHVLGKQYWTYKINQTMIDSFLKVGKYKEVGK